MKRLLSLAALSLAACGPAKNAEDLCLGYDCDADGAAKMMQETLSAAYEPSERAQSGFDEVFTRGVKRMTDERGFTPDGFQLAKDNLQRFLRDVPEAGDDPLGPEAEALKHKTSKLCPLWPYC